MAVLRQLGFSGTDEQVVEKAGTQTPHLLSAASSASSMWVANAATVAPSADTLDGKVHLTVANLNNKFHRASEAETTGRVLRAILIMMRILRCIRRCRRLRCLAMKGRQTTTVWAATMAIRVYSCLSMDGKRAATPRRFVIRRDKP